MEGAKRAYRFHGTPYGQYVPKLEPPTHCDWCTLPFEEGMLKVPDRKFPLIKETNWKPGHFAFSERIGWFHVNTHWGMLGYAAVLKVLGL